MSSQGAIKQALRQELAAGRVVPVVGAGFSRAVANFPSWIGLIQAGLQHAKDSLLCEQEEHDRVQDLLREGRLVDAASSMRQLLDAPNWPFAAWLHDTFAKSADDYLFHQLPHRLSDLCCPLYATTNYDRLLSDLLLDRPAPVTWGDPEAMLLARRYGGRLLHLHGIFDEPASVVLGAGDYDAVVGNEAYRAVLEALWVTKTLLFVCCSFDGITDPDFSALLEWAHRTFARSHYRHYALLHERDLDPDRVRRLQKLRIQPISYGPGFDDLQEALREINPNREKAFARRALHVRAIQLGVDPASKRAFSAELDQLRSNSSSIADDEFERLASIIYQRHENSEKLRSGDLEDFQSLAREMVDRALLEESISRFRAGKVDSYDESLRKSVLQASAVLQLFDAELLGQLYRRGFNVDSAVLDGYAQQLLAEAEAKPMWFVNDYTIENAKRILTSVAGILEADPRQMTLTASKGTRAKSTFSSALMIVQDQRIDLRDSDDIDQLIASLDIPGPRLLGAAVLPCRGKDAVVAFNSEHVIAWDPRRAASPYIDRRFDLPFPIRHVAHRLTPKGLETVVVQGIGGTRNDRWIELLELETQCVWQSRKPIEIPGLVLTDIEAPNFFGEDALGIASGALVIASRSGVMTPILLASNLAMRVDSLPGGSVWRDFRLEADRSRTDAVERMRKSEIQMIKETAEALARSEAVKLAFTGLKRTRLAGEPAWGVQIDVSGPHVGHGSLLLFLDGRSVALRGHAWLPDRTLTHFEMFDGPDGAPWLVYAVHPDYQGQRWDVVGWSRGARSGNQYAFLPRGSGLRGNCRVLDLAMHSPDTGYALDETGKLYPFSVRNGFAPFVLQVQSPRSLSLDQWG